MTNTPALETEKVRSVEAFTQAGYTLPYDLTISSLLQGVGWAIMPDQNPPAHLIPDLGPASKHYFASIVQPDMRRRLERSDDGVLRLAHSLGRLSAAGTEAGLVRPNVPLIIEGSTIKTDSRRAELPFQPESMIDYGMGYNGLISHLPNLRKRAYRVIGIHHEVGEVAFLNGMVEFFGVSGQFENHSEGLSRTVPGLADSRPSSADVIIASRVQGAGYGLEVGINRAPDLLKPGGLLIARGPAHSSNKLAYPYDKVLRQLQRTRGMQVEVEHTFVAPGPSGPEKMRLIVARHTAVPSTV